MSPSASTLGPAVAGSWYPASPGPLRDLVEEFLAEGRSASEASGDTVALIAPHAGFVYSGAVAARTVRRLPVSGTDRVILLGPSHYASFVGGCVPASRAYRTPLGNLPIDRDAAERCAASPGIRMDDRPFRPEHSLEAEIPFLQAHLAAGFRLLPVLVGGGSSWADMDALAEALGPLLEAGSRLVVSSDFTHYGPRFGYVPFASDVPESLRALDMGAVERIVALDRPGLRAYVERTGATICGRLAIDVLLAVLGEESRGELVDYDTSGRITGDWEHSVSYAGLAFRRGSGA